MRDEMDALIERVALLEAQVAALATLAKDFTGRSAEVRYPELFSHGKPDCVCQGKCRCP